MALVSNAQLESLNLNLHWKMKIVQNHHNTNQWIFASNYKWSFIFCPENSQPNWNRKASLISTVEHSIRHWNVFVCEHTEVICICSIFQWYRMFLLIFGHYYINQYYSISLIFLSLISVRLSFYTLWVLCTATASCLWLINYEHQISCSCCCYSSQLIVCIFYYDFSAYSAWAISSSFYRTYRYCASECSFLMKSINHFLICVFCFHLHDLILFASTRAGYNILENAQPGI